MHFHDSAKLYPDEFMVAQRPALCRIINGNFDLAREQSALCSAPDAAPACRIEDGEAVNERKHPCCLPLDSPSGAHSCPVAWLHASGGPRTGPLPLRRVPGSNDKKSRRKPAALALQNHLYEKQSRTAVVKAKKKKKGGVTSSQCAGGRLRANLK